MRSGPSGVTVATASPRCGVWSANPWADRPIPPDEGPRGEREAAPAAEVTRRPGRPHDPPRRPPTPRGRPRFPAPRRSPMTLWARSMTPGIPVSSSPSSTAPDRLGTPTGVGVGIFPRDARCSSGPHSTSVARHPHGCGSFTRFPAFSKEMVKRRYVIVQEVPPKSSLLGPAAAGLVAARVGG